VTRKAGHQIRSKSHPPLHASPHVLSFDALLSHCGSLHLRMNRRDQAIRALLQR